MLSPDCKDKSAKSLHLHLPVIETKCGPRDNFCIGTITKGLLSINTGSVCLDKRKIMVGWKDGWFLSMDRFCQRNSVTTVQAAVTKLYRCIV